MKKEQSFESALARLEEIADLLERGGEPLEDAMKLYQEGAALAAFCSKKLSAAQTKLKELSPVNEQERTVEDEND